MPCPAGCATRSKHSLCRTRSWGCGSSRSCRRRRRPWTPPTWVRVERRAATAATTSSLPQPGPMPRLPCADAERAGERGLGAGCWFEAPALSSRPAACGRRWGSMRLGRRSRPQCPPDRRDAGPGYLTLAPRRTTPSESADVLSVTCAAAEVRRFRDRPENDPSGRRGMRPSTAFGSLIGWRMPGRAAAFRGHPKGWCRVKWMLANGRRDQ
jgi:hypothetical protein